MASDYKTYRAYLSHPRFLEVKKVAWQRANGACEMCRSRRPKDTHHLRYPKWGTFDVPENLLVVCRECHCKIHGKES